MYRWKIAAPDPAQQQILCESLGLSPITAQLLINRGLTTPASAGNFLNPALSQLHDPFTLPDMPRAVDRIVAALERREPITIYGDYDTDGACATALLLRFLHAAGAAHVDAYIPHRTQEGYGLHVAALDRLAGRGTALVITVDTGTTAHEAIAYAKARGMDVIVTDHHEVVALPDAAYAVINPKRPDSTYPFDGLCGAGVAFKLLMALRRALRERGWFATHPEPALRPLLDLVAVATVADVVPLVDENRVLCAAGLRQLAKAPQCGLDALMRVAGVDRARIDSYTIGFGIAPRINAAGRLAHADAAVRLLTTDDAAQADQIAGELQKLNVARQQVEGKIQEAIHERLGHDPQLRDRASIVLASTEWPAGVVGIVAGRLAEQYRVPTIVIGLDDAGVGRGSARTVGDFPLLEAIAHCGQWLQAYGGHRMAAGLTIHADQIDAFASAFEAHARTLLTPAMRERVLSVDAEAAAADLTMALVDELAQLGPHGLGNREPLLVVRDLAVQEERVVGTKHLRMRLGFEAVVHAAIGFSLATHPVRGSRRVDVACTPQINVWQGVTSLQLKLRDLAKSST